MMAIAMQEGRISSSGQHKRMDGASSPATVLLTRMELEGKRVLQATVRDITERKQAEERQGRSLRRLERVNRLQEDLLLPGSLEEKFKKITDAAVELLDLDFCRIWKMNRATSATAAASMPRRPTRAMCVAIATNAFT